MSDSQNLLDDFVAESTDLLAGIEAQVRIVFDTGDRSPLHRVFRAVHTVKGSSGFLGLLNIKNFSHSLEDILDRLRSNLMPLAPNLERQIVRCLDLLSAMVTRAGLEPAEVSLTEDESNAIELLLQAARECGDENDAETTLCKIAEYVHSVGDDAGEPWTQLQQMAAPWLAKGRSGSAADGPPGEWLQRAFECRFVAGAADVTDLVSPCLDFFTAPSRGEELPPKTPKFLDDAAALTRRIRELGSESSADILDKMIAECRIIHESPIDLDELLLSTLIDQAGQVLVPWMKSPAAETPPDAEFDKSAVAAKTDDADGEKRTDGDRSGKSGTIRIREATLDQFIWHVGEIFLALEAYRDLQHRLGESNAPMGLVSELSERNRELAVAVGKLQHSVAEVRRVPAGTLLHRIPPMARSLADQLGKEIAVHLDGTEGLVDRSLLQSLEGPMTHLIRNALDHGFPDAEERLASGKPPVGNLWIRCRIERENVVFEVEDDGRGIDPNRVLNKALERGLVSSTQAELLSESEVVALVCLPGFSTAEKVSDVSGRGVGMDVVLSTVERSGGRLNIESRLGLGTKFTLTFPLKSTVLMIDGLLCETAGHHAAFPVEFVNEVVILQRDMLACVSGDMVARIRDRTYPVVPMARVLGLGTGVESGEPISALDGSNGVIISHQRRSVLLSVDRLAGYRKMVLKDFDRELIECKLLSGVAQLSGSKLALVFDVPELLRSIGV